MNRFGVASVVLSLAGLCFAGELDVARQALRDGLWEVARTHALRLEGEEAKLLVLESYCRESRWADALKTLSAWTVEEDEGFLYFKALALSETGRKTEARELLSKTKFTRTDYQVPAARLRAKLAIDCGNADEALEILKETGFAEADVESRMAAAGILSAAGDRKGAEKIWREVVADTNANERAYVTAAVNLDELELLRSAYARAKGAELHRLAGLRLGVRLIKSDETFEEGAKAIKAIAADAPDAEGASDAYVALADMYLTHKRYQDASDAYRYLLATWPAVAFSSQVQEGRGWAFRELGRNEEALEAFARAEETASDDTARATAILEQGDVLSQCGRGEEAMVKYRQVLDKYPKTPAGEKLKVLVKLRELEAKGRDLYKNYDFAEAQKVFAEVAKEDPSRKPRMDFFEVLCLYGQGLDREARDKAREIADNGTDPSIRAEATLWLAKFAYNRRRWNDSGRLFAAYADMQPKAKEAPSALTWAARAAFAENDFKLAIQTVTKLAERYPDSPEKARGYLVQGEALIELARFDEAVLVLERTVLAEGTPAVERLRAQVLKADALFAMGADNPVRYREALDAYRAVRLGESLTPSLKVSVSFKIGLTLEKLRRHDEAIDQYYTEVVLAYREGRLKGTRFDDEARAAFVRAAFGLAEEYESRGKDFQAMHILELVVASDVPAADEAEKRIDRIQTKGKLL